LSLLDRDLLLLLLLLLSYCMATTGNIPEVDLVSGEDLGRMALPLLMKISFLFVKMY